MRIPDFLSPTSIRLFNQDIEEFYLAYLADVRPPRLPQTRPMSVGSAFDAFVKSYLYESLYGKNHNARYALDALLEAQVEPHNRDWARAAGLHVFNEYEKIGCLGDLMLELNKSVGRPRFEFEIKDTMQTRIGEVPLLGKPDVFFINSEGARVILDWKVNGYCASRTTSPMKGYVKLRPGDRIHRDCVLLLVNGIYINTAMHLEDGNEDWADQLSIYSWLLGEPVGSEEMIVGIDQIVGPADSLRFATHRLRISPDWQYSLLEQIIQIWKTINSGYIFRDLSIEESKARCEQLDSMVQADHDELFMELTC